MTKHRWYGALAHYLGVLVPTIISGLLLLVQMIGVWQPPLWLLTLIMIIGFATSFALTVRRLVQQNERLEAQLDKPQVEIANPTAGEITLMNWLNVHQGQYHATLTAALTLAAEFSVIYRGVSPANAELRYGGVDIDWQRPLEPTTVVAIFEADGSNVPDGRLILLPNAVPRVRATVLVDVPWRWGKKSLAHYSGLTHARLFLEVEVGGRVYRSSVSYDVAGFMANLVREVLNKLIEITRSENDAKKLALAVWMAAHALVALCVPLRQPDDTGPRA